MKLFFMFLVVCFFFQFLLRRVGWGASKGFLYAVSMPICVSFLVLWGVAVAFGYRHLVLWLHPGIAAKIIGYGSAGYVSVPNYGLIAQHTIPEHQQIRHAIVSNLPLITFIVFSFVFAYLI